MGKFTKLDKRKLEQIIRDSPGIYNNALRETAIEIVNDIVSSFGTSPPGERYGDHVASVEGYPANPDTGTQKAGIHMEPKGFGEFWVMDGTGYGYPQEVGTARMGPRPFMRPAFERASARFSSKFRGLI